MPELPEVETIARGVDARVRGDRVVEAWFSSHREPFKTPPGRQAKGLEGKFFLGVHRTGKHIVCELSGTYRTGRVAGGEGVPEAAVDRSPGDDGTAAGDDAGRAGGGSHPRAAAAQERTGAAVCGSAGDLGGWSFGSCTRRKALRERAPSHWPLGPMSLRRCFGGGAWPSRQRF